MGTFRYVGTSALISRGLRAMKQAVEESAEDLVKQAQDRTPVDTGTLKASLHATDATVYAFSVRARVQTGGEANDYAVFVHEGTTKMAGRPFLSQALIDNRAVYIEAIARAARGAF